LAWTNALPGHAGPLVGACQHRRGLVVDADVAGIGVDVLGSLCCATESPLQAPDARLLEALDDLAVLDDLLVRRGLPPLG
jgi:hypothetical protein